MKNKMKNKMKKIVKIYLITLLVACGFEGTQSSKSIKDVKTIDNNLAIYHKELGISYNKKFGDWFKGEDLDEKEMEDDLGDDKMAKNCTYHDYYNTLPSPPDCKKLSKEDKDEKMFEILRECYNDRIQNWIKENCQKINTGNQIKKRPKIMPHYNSTSIRITPPDNNIEEIQIVGQERGPVHDFFDIFKIHKKKNIYFLKHGCPYLFHINPRITEKHGNTLLHSDNLLMYAKPPCDNDLELKAIFIPGMRDNKKKHEYYRRDFRIIKKQLKALAIQQILINSFNTYVPIYTIPENHNGEKKFDLIDKKNIIKNIMNELSLLNVYMCKVTNMKGTYKQEIPIGLDIQISAEPGRFKCRISDYSYINLSIRGTSQENENPLDIPVEYCKPLAMVIYGQAITDSFSDIFPKDIIYMLLSFVKLEEHIDKLKKNIDSGLDIINPKIHEGNVIRREFLNIMRGRALDMSYEDEDEDKDESFNLTEKEKLESFLKNIRRYKDQDSFISEDISNTLVTYLKNEAYANIDDIRADLEEKDTSGIIEHIEKKHNLVGDDLKYLLDFLRECA